MKNTLKLDHCILFSVVFLVILSLYFSWRSPVARAIRDGHPLNGIIIGTDWVDYARHSDTLILASYNPAARFLNILSIPRDTRFTPAGYRFRRINEIYAYHFRTKKDDFLACQEVRIAVEQLLRNRVTIPHYLQIDYKSFRTFIDLIGGVTVEVEEPMHYDDNAGKLHIHFDPGTHHLSGQQALEYVRYRGKAGDIGRVWRQQRFLTAVIARFKNPAVILRLPRIIRAATKDIRTDLSLWDLLAAAIELKDIGAKNIRLTQLPGSPKNDYWEIDEENCAGLVERIFPSGSLPAETAPKVRVEVWNASGKHRLAEQVNWVLRQRGYDVIDYGTFTVRQKKTLIKDLTGDLRSAQQIAEIISCGEVVTRYDAKRFVDISVILGEDCSVSGPDGQDTP